MGFVGVGAYVSGILSLSSAAKASYLPDLPRLDSRAHFDFLSSTLVAGVISVVLAFLVGAPLMQLWAFRLRSAGLSHHRQRRADQRRRLHARCPYLHRCTTPDHAALGDRLASSLPDRAGAHRLFAKGRAWRAVREDTIAAQAIGIDVLPTGLSAFVIGAFFAGVGGSLYGHYLGSFSPAGFYFAYTLSLISMLVIGGMQSMTGAVLGVIIVSLLSELLRNLERGFHLGSYLVPPLYGASQIVLGIILILIMIFRPTGVVGDLELSFGRIAALLHKGRKE